MENTLPNILVSSIAGAVTGGVVGGIVSSSRPSTTRLIPQQPSNSSVTIDIDNPQIQTYDTIEDIATIPNINALILQDELTQAIELANNETELINEFGPTFLPTFIANLEVDSSPFTNYQQILETTLQDSFGVINIVNSSVNTHNNTNNIIDINSSNIITTKNSLSKYINLLNLNDFTVTSTNNILRRVNINNTNYLSFELEKMRPWIGTTFESNTYNNPDIIIGAQGLLTYGTSSNNNNIFIGVGTAKLGSISTISIGNMSSTLTPRTQATCIPDPYIYDFFTSNNTNCINIGVNAGIRTHGYSSDIIKDYIVYYTTTSSILRTRYSSIYSIYPLIGFPSGTTGECISIGTNAGYDLCQPFTINLGYSAGALASRENCINIGVNAGRVARSKYSIAIGDHAGYFTNIDKHVSTESIYDPSLGYNIAIGNKAGFFDQTHHTIAIGNEAGYSGQNFNNIAIGSGAGRNNQSLLPGDDYGLTGHSIAIGTQAGEIDQRGVCIAIGYQAGQYSQEEDGIAIGYRAGRTGQYAGCVYIGYCAGEYNISSSNYGSIGIGYEAGQNLQGGDCIALGYRAGNISQNSNAIAIGSNAGESGQGTGSFALGFNSGRINQGINAFSLGTGAGSVNQGNYSVAIGNSAGATNQGIDSISIGRNSGTFNQSDNCIAIGTEAGAARQGKYGIALGINSGRFYQCNESIAIGNNIELNNTVESAAKNKVAIALKVRDTTSESLLSQNEGATGYESFMFTGTNNPAVTNKSVIDGDSLSVTAGPNEIVASDLADIYFNSSDNVSFMCTVIKKNGQYYKAYIPMVACEPISV